ncbi:MAG TPA: class I SAM-dependent methyltransferase [Candidatus Saccharimonas sp.]|nr:class I SAM-dependent methyltransferase [Candidatus Saccharimonas sp.]
MRTNIIKRRGYDPAIAGDELSLRIASPLITARYIANRLKNHGRTVCELCCGIGVSLIELAAAFENVIGVDNDTVVIENCKQNLARAGVTNYSLLCGDVSDRQLLGSLAADVVLYDIPYWSNHDGQVDAAGQNPDLAQLVANIRQLITGNIVIYAPAHMTYAEARAALGPCEFTKIYIDGRHDRNFVFLGALAEQNGERTIEIASKTG